MSRAKRFDYKGRTGRLAVVDSKAVHRWLIRSFRLRGDTWIGLRYWCSYRQLAWVTGNKHALSAFGAWHQPWARGAKDYCASESVPFMPIYYNGKTARWQATGSNKSFRYYMIEYPPAKAAAPADTN